MRGEDASNGAVTPIPHQRRLTHQILKHWQPFQVLQQTFTVSRRVEQLRRRMQQRIVATAEDFVLRTEMRDLESQEENGPKCVLWYKPMAWLGEVRPSRRHGSWSASLWQSFLALAVGA